MAKTATKPVTKAAAKSKPVTKTKGERGYKNHLSGSRKEAVHRMFDLKGPEAARDLGLEAGLKPSTLASWFGGWSRSAKPVKAKTTAAKAA